MSIEFQKKILNLKIELRLLFEKLFILERVDLELLPKKQVGKAIDKLNVQLHEMLESAVLTSSGGKGKC